MGALFDALDIAQDLYESERVHLCAMHAYGPMQMWPGGAAGGTDGAERLAPVERSAFLDVDFMQMAVHGHEA